MSFRRRTTRHFRFRICTAWIALSILFAFGEASFVRAQETHAFDSNRCRYTEDGQLIRPEGWRKWVYVGTPLTPHDMNDGKAAFPEFHNVYVDPESFATFERTGEFPDGTQLVKELTLVGSKSAVSGNGYFMGEFSGLEVAVKDSIRFKDEPGGWAYFSFGHVPEDQYAKTAKVLPAAQCNACHAASADTDYVFTQYYPILRAVMSSDDSVEQDQKNASMKKMDDAAMKNAMGAVGASSSETSKPDDYGAKVFAWLQKRGYKNFRAESSVHPSSSGPAVHGDVRVFVNEKLDASLRSDSATHPTGSVAVKELHKEGALYGWAVAIKASKDDGIGNGWFWYENLSTTNASKPVAASLGNQLCVGCHSPGKDFMRTQAIK